MVSIPSARLTATQLTRLLGQGRTKECSRCRVPRPCALQAGFFTSADQRPSVAKVGCQRGPRMIRNAFQGDIGEGKGKEKQEDEIFKILFTI